MKPTLAQRIDAILDQRGRMSFYDLAVALYPDRKSWRFQQNGGPPGCYMALSRTIRRYGFGESYNKGNGTRMVSARPKAGR